MMHEAARRLTVVPVAVSALLFAGSGIAFAHVTVDPSTAAVGSETVFSFRVPDEQEHASTIKVVIAMPVRTPIPVVSLQPVPGWTGHVTVRKLAQPVQSDEGPVDAAVSRVVWKADKKSSAIAPGQFQQFTIEAGPLPSAKLLLFKVLQHYSDGSVVRWIDPPAKGGEAAAHPAPAVTVIPSAAPLVSSRSAVSGNGSTGPTSDDGWIAVAAFVAGLLGFAAGSAALVRVHRNDESRSHRSGQA